MDEENKNEEEQTEEVAELYDEEKPRSFNEALEDIVNNPKFKLDPRWQYMRGGKLFQVVAKFRPHKNSVVPVSICVDHTPRNKYTGAMLREIRKQKGVGRPRA